MSTDAEVMAAVNERLRTLSNLVGATSPSRPESSPASSSDSSDSPRRSGASSSIVARESVRQGPPRGTDAERRPRSPLDELSEPSPNVRTPNRRGAAVGGEGEREGGARARRRGSHLRRPERKRKPRRRPPRVEPRSSKMTAEKARVEREPSNPACAAPRRPARVPKRRPRRKRRRRKRGGVAEESVGALAAEDGCGDEAAARRAETTRARAAAAAAAAKEREAAKDAREAATLRERPRARLGFPRAPAGTPPHQPSPLLPGGPPIRLQSRESPRRRRSSRGGHHRRPRSPRPRVHPRASTAVHRRSRVVHRPPRPGPATPLSHGGFPIVVAGGSHSPEVPAESFSRASRLDAREALSRAARGRRASRRRRGRCRGTTRGEDSPRARFSQRAGPVGSRQRGFPDPAPGHCPRIGASARLKTGASTRGRSTPRVSTRRRGSFPIQLEPSRRTRASDRRRRARGRRISPPAAAAMRWPGEELDAFDAALDATRWRPPRATSARKPLGGRPSFAFERVASVSDRIAPRLTNAPRSAPGTTSRRRVGDVAPRIWPGALARSGGGVVARDRRAPVERRAWGACVARSVAVARAATAGAPSATPPGRNRGRGQTASRPIAPPSGSPRCSNSSRGNSRANLVRAPAVRVRSRRTSPWRRCARPRRTATRRNPWIGCSRPRSRGRIPKTASSYWSSAGSTTRDATDHVVLRLERAVGGGTRGVDRAVSRVFPARETDVRARARIRVHVGLSPITAPTAPTTATAADARDPDDPAAPSRGGFTPGGYSDPPGAAAHDWRTGESSGRGYGRRPSSRWRPPRRRNGSRSRRPRCALGESSPSNSRVDTRDRRRTGYGTSPSRTFVWRECRCPGTCPRR